jgi:hypothetical protein
MHATRKPLRIVRLDDEMDVIALYRKMDQPKIVAPVCGVERALQRAETNRLPQMTDLASHAHGHVNRLPVLQDLARPVRHMGSFCATFAACAAAFAASRAEDEAELFALIGHCFKVMRA